MKRTMKFEFDTSNTDDLAKMYAMDTMASVLDNADHTKAFMQCARAIQLGRRIEIMPPEGEGAKPAKTSPLKPVEGLEKALKEVPLPAPPGKG